MSKVKIFLLLQFVFFFSLPVLAQVDTVWVRRYDGPGNGNDEASALAVDNSGNVYVTGRSVGRRTDYYYATIKYDPHGDTLWVRRYNGPGNSPDSASALAVDNSGNVYVTGRSSGSGTDYDYATIKYAPNGDTLWVRRYNGPGNSYDDASALAVDNSGNVYVTGGSWGSGTYSDYATIKYAPNGDTQWVRRYNGPANDDDEASALAVDNSGNVYVTGWSGVYPNTDYATIKYAPNGDTLWVRRYNGPGNSYDEASAVAVDNSGNVYVTGGSLGSGTSFDYATIKYAPNGDTLWVRRYDGPRNGPDEASALAVDNSCNVYVTGHSIDSVTSYDYATIKYAAGPCDYGNGKNHYKTWSVVLPQQLIDTAAIVRDQFMQDTLKLDSIEFLSNPVKKVVGIDTFDIKKPDDHLNWYRATGRDTLLRIEYLNQFESTSVQIDSVKYLLVPAQKYPHPAPESLDHYKCYRIRNSQMLVRPVELLDQFDIDFPELIDTLVPLYFCTPAQKNSEPMYDTLTHYVAYLIKPKRSIFDSRTTTDQFGYHFMQILESEMLLVPTKKLRVTVPPSGFGRNHYKTWRIQPQPLDTSVFVRDQFMQDTLRLDTIDFLSNPAQKVVQFNTFDIKKPDDHLNWYRAHGRNTLIHLQYVNQFESTSVDIDSVKYLLVPAQKPPHPAPESLDHYKCYRIKKDSLLIGQFRLKDQFDSLYRSNQFELIDFLKRAYFCPPCRKNNEPTYDTITHYVAYSFDADTLPIAPILGTLDQFGPHPVQVYQSEMVLVPTKKLTGC